jgi:dTDP-4-amino-4,6-dideoxygalactose transaminase
MPDSAFDKPITVTQPALPPLEDSIPFLKQIWESRCLTNCGPFHEQLEHELTDYLGVKHISLFTNGTLALICALKALNIQGEVITTPFSFVATCHSLLWNNIQPIFSDIGEDDLNLDPDKIEAAITPRTTAILPVHVYGNPCKMNTIQKVADKYGLKVIYDAAHAFGVRKNGESLLKNGDLSILSFHATKVFNTFEGGAIICHDALMKHHIDNLKNFGFRDEIVVEELGINAKMNEFQAAIGMLQLKYINQHIKNRKLITETYRNLLQNIPGLRLLQDMNGVQHNYSYFPVFIDESLFGKTRDELYLVLQENRIFGRRYFFPLISDFPMYENLPSAHPENLPVARKMANQVICLPIYPDLDLKVVENIARIIRNYQG